MRDLRGACPLSGRKTVTVVRKNRVHFVANCSDCSWETANFLKGPEQAKDHAKKHRHIVTGESGYAHEYQGRKIKEPKP